jgi:5-methyltetrahydropteroyltriglutamate--homocysteine methyltransferase
VSAHRIPCTHTGSLPRPDQLVQLMFAVSDGIPVDQEALQSAIDDAIGEIVQRQLDAGVTVINDGEMSKPSYATYVQDRLAGFEGETVQNYFFEDLQDFPRSAEMVAGNPGRRKRKAPSCTAPITVTNGQAAIDDMVALSAAAKARGHDQIFSSAASPGVISLFFNNDFYASHEEYVFAIA